MHSANLLLPHLSFSFSSLFSHFAVPAFSHSRSISQFPHFSFSSSRTPAPQGVRSNVLAPGPIAGTEGLSRLTTQSSQAASDYAPTGRDGSMQDIANAAVFLFSPAARYITGQAIAVDGGSEHLRSFQLPYPQAVLDPGSVTGLIKPRL